MRIVTLKIKSQFPKIDQPIFQVVTITDLILWHDGENGEDKRSPLLDVNAKINEQNIFFIFCGGREGGLLVKVGEKQKA